MRTIQDMVQQEVLCCMSIVVSTLASGYGTGIWDGGKSAKAVGDALPNLIGQAFELACPVKDYEEAAIQAGYDFLESKDLGCLDMVLNAGGEIVCHYGSKGESANTIAARHFGGEPYDREVYEHWSVTDWFADKLIAHGEKVDKDFAGLCIWARTTTGQAIHADSVIERIYADTHKV